MPGFVDVHSHVVPSGDDGADSIEEGLALCRLARRGRHRASCSRRRTRTRPGTRIPARAERDRLYAASFAEMRDEVAAWGLDLRRGWEVYPSEIAGSDPAELVLEGTRGVLIEFPGSWLEIDDPIGVGRRGRGRGRGGGPRAGARPPRALSRRRGRPRRASRPFAERGWLLCLNAPSLVGGHGATAERTAWALLEAGLVALVGLRRARRLAPADARRRIRGRARAARRRRRAAAVRRQRASLGLRRQRRRGASRPARRPPSSSRAFAREKWRQPKKPLLAEYGDGCAAVSTWWRVVSTIAPFCCA